MSFEINTGIPVYLQAAVFAPHSTNGSTLDSEEFIHLCTNVAQNLSYGITVKLI